MRSYVNINMEALSIYEFPRAILHLDADSFFASVESSKSPKLRGKPVVTGSERGIATSMSYEAKALGITRGMPVFKIRKEFPQAIIVHSDYEAYAMYSRRMFAVVRRYTDIVEEYSIDECFADITDYQRVNNMTYREILEKIQLDIHNELNISVSLGCAPTKVLAKVGSKWNKPHGITMIPGTRAHEFLSKIPVGDIWGIGKSTTGILMSKGIVTAYDFTMVSEKILKNFVHAPLIDIWKELQGEQVMMISTVREKPKSISRTLSFKPYKTKRSELFSELSCNVENACIMARREHIAPKVITWFLKTRDLKFESSKIVLDRPSNIPIDILNEIKIQFEQIKTEGKEYRTTGVTLSDFYEEENIQDDLFGVFTKAHDKNEIFKIVDTLGQKYGRHVVQVASSIQASIYRGKNYQDGRIQNKFFNRIKKTGKELCIPYLGETV